MEQVIVSGERCLDNKSEVVVDDARLTELKKPKKRKKSRSKNKPNGARHISTPPLTAPDKTVSHGVLSPVPVQECLVTETVKDEVPAKLTKAQKQNIRTTLKKKANKLLESLDNPTSLGAIDQIASGDILSTKRHEAVTDTTTSKKRKRNQRAKKTAAGDVLSAKVDETVVGKTVTDDTMLKKKKKKRNKKKKKVAGDVLSAKLDEMVPDKAVTDNTTPKMKNEKGAGDVLSAKVNEVVSSETVPSNTTPKKKKRNKKNRKLKTVAGENIQGKVNAIDGPSATEVTEARSGEMVSGKTVLPDVKMASEEEAHTEAANGKMGSSATTNLNMNGAVNLNSDSGETGSGTNAADTTASKKRKRKKKSPLSGDVSNTCENIQDKVNGLSTTKVVDTQVTSKTELSDITNHNVDGKKGLKVVNSEVRKAKKQKFAVDPSENTEIISQPTSGKKLIIFDVNGMLADIVFPRPTDVEADKYSRGKAVFKRPYLDDFLSFCFENFNVAIWSSRMKKNLDPVVDCLFGDLKKKLLFVWDASHCRNSGMRTLEDRYKCIVFKELRKIWETDCSAWVKGSFNESNTLLLDDSPYKALLNPKHTGIFPTTYKYTDTNDDYLGPTGALRTYLEGFAAADDGRTYVEQNPFGEGPIDEMNRDWKYYSRVLKGQSAYCTSQGITI